MRFRFSLRTLLLFSLLCGSLMLLWRNRESWRVYRSVREPQDIWAVGFSPRDTFFFTASSNMGSTDPAGHTVNIYERSSGQLHTIIRCPQVRTDEKESSFTIENYFFSPGEKYLLRQDRNSYKHEMTGIWGVDTGLPLQFENGPAENLRVVQISANDNFALLGNDPNNLALVKLPSLETIARMPRGHEGFFSPDERWLAFYDMRGARHTLRLYSTGTGKEDTRFAWGEGCGAVQFSPDGRLIAYDSGDYHRRAGVVTTLVDLQTGYELRTLNGEMIFGGNNFSPDSRFIFTRDPLKQQMWAWDLNSQSAAVLVMVPPQSFPGINNIREGKLFHDKILANFDASSGELIWLNSHRGYFAPNGEYALDSETADVLSGASGQAVIRLRRMEEWRYLSVVFANCAPEFATYYHVSGIPSFEYDYCNQVNLFQRRRPEAWWGIAWLWEFWVVVALTAAMIWSLRRDR